MRHFLTSSVVILSSSALLACGTSAGDPGYGSSPAPAAPTPSGPAVKPTWDQVAAIIQADCAPCHNGTKEPAFSTSAAFTSSQAKAELTSGAMPQPPATISVADKATLLGFLQ